MVGDSYPNNGTDQGVGAGCRKAQPPGAEIPDNRCDQQSEDHGKTRFAANLQNQFDRQQRDDAESDRAAGGQDAEEIPHSGPNHCDVRFESMGVNYGGDGVGRVVKTVYEFKG